MKRNQFETNLMNSIKKQNGGEIADERQKLYNMSALVCGLTAGLALDIVMITYHFVIRNIEGTYPYIAQILIIAIFFCLASRRNADITLPKTIFGKPLNADKTVSGFFKRLIWYAADAVSFTVFLIALDAYTEGKISGSFISDGIISFVVFALYNIVFCEFRVHRYRKYTAKLARKKTT